MKYCNCERWEKAFSAVKSDLNAEIKYEEYCQFCGRTLFQKLSDGIYRVKVTSGIILPLNLLRDKKIITGNRGLNTCFGITWGKFSVESNRGLIKLIYDNGNIVDNLYLVKNTNNYNGEFYFKEKFLGYFKLEKI